MPPKKKDSKMTSAELRKLIRAHNKLSNITIPKGSTRDEIIIIIEKNGYTVDHVNKELKPKVKRGKIISVKQAEKMFPKKTEAQKKEAKDKREAKKKEAKDREGKLIKAGATMQKALAKKKAQKKEAPKKKGKEIGTQTEDPEQIKLELFNKQYTNIESRLEKATKIQQTKIIQKLIQKIIKEVEEFIKTNPVNKKEVKKFQKTIPSLEKKLKTKKCEIAKEKVKKSLK